VTFVKQKSIDNIQFLNCGQVYIFDENVEKEMEMEKALSTCIYEMSCSDAEEVVNMRSHMEENLIGALERDFRQDFLVSTNLQDIQVVIPVTHVGRRRVIPYLEISD
jgi:hypothetical protein